MINFDGKPERKSDEQEPKGDPSEHPPIPPYKYDPSEDRPIRYVPPPKKDKPPDVPPAPAREK